MLPNHAPLIVAEQFGTLEALYPKRIDLGLGRAPGGDFLTMRALRRDSRQSGDDFPEQLEELRGYPAPRGTRVAPAGVDYGGMVVPFALATDAGTMTFLSTTTVFGTPVDITLSELALECFYPADEVTAEMLKGAG